MGRRKGFNQVHLEKNTAILQIKDKQKTKYKRQTISANVEVQTLKTPSGLVFRRTKPIGGRNV